MDIKPGDRFRHKKWPKGTPDAVVGEVDDGYVKWREVGGSQIPGVIARFLTTEYGWERVASRTP